VSATVDGGRGTAPTGPLALAADWLPSPGSGVTPVVTLSTTGLDGYPSARTVLLSRFDGERLHFHTDTRSRKAAELAADPRATVTVLLPEASRQLVVTGDVTPVTDDEARAAWTARTRYLQVLAWLNDHDLATEPEAVRRDRWAAFVAERGDGLLDPPDTWTGFALTPVRLLFWQGDVDGPSNRSAWTRRADGGWALEHWPG